jgi:predicted phosphodiesterase
MVCCIISDIHSNLEALHAVLHAVESTPADALFCLGDLVGYNADPDLCVKDVLSRAASTIRGNHDKAVAGLLPMEWFNGAAQDAISWTRKTVTAETLEALEDLKEGPVNVGEGILLCHGSPMDEDRYMHGPAAIKESFRFLAARHPNVRYCFHGHTHVPQVVRMGEGGGRASIIPLGREVALEPQATYLINPGSVGQPRDGNPMASFGILDTGNWTYRGIRVGYAVAETRKKIVAAGLPDDLARRLEEGW